MDLSIRRTETGTEDQSWLGSAHGTNACRTITLDLSAFTKATHYPKGVLKSGIALRKLANGLYGPWAAAGEGEDQNILAGFLFTTQRVHDGATRIGAPLYEHGRINTARLPIPVPEAAQATAAGRIIFA